MIHLQDITSPQDIKTLSKEETDLLCEEIRQKIISTVAKQGGHLASNLGMVELTVAIHRVFDAPEDKILFDVGHQCYTHKLLTGRYKAFDTLRSKNGLSGFPKSHESEYDCFETGHSATAISAALGMARARDLQGKKNHIIAVVGDGALTGGMCYEALNDAGNDNTRLIVIVNDNGMSISPNVGALSTHLSNLRASRSWNTAKVKVKSQLNRIPGIGPALHRFIHSSFVLVKRIFVHENFFTSLGFRYLGPIDGHNTSKIVSILEKAKYLDGPVVVHCHTQKGHGYEQAELKPEIFHGIPPFYTESGDICNVSSPTIGHYAVDKLIHLAKTDDRIVAVTAAMLSGTGLEGFQKAYPNRTFDVGIAEEHAATMCAGLAKAGMKPFFFVYSTFLQRAYDQVLHDICLQNLPVCLMIDKVGLVGQDGVTHQGIYDISFLSEMPNLSIFSPACKSELAQMVEYAANCGTPCAIRYPRSEEEIVLPSLFKAGKWQMLRDGRQAVLLPVGSMIAAAMHIAQRLEADGILVSVYHVSTIQPLDKDVMQSLIQRQLPVITMEEHVLTGGFGSIVGAYRNHGKQLEKLYSIGISNPLIEQGTHDEQLAMADLTDDKMYKNIVEYINRENKNVQ